VSASNVSATLDDVHAALCDDMRMLATAKAIVRSFRQANMLTDEEERLRLLALNQCPGHNSPRAWCAYCGDVRSTP
jgi:hypothetical protein